MLGLKVVVFIDEFNGETLFAQLGFSWPGKPKMSRKLVHSFGHLAENSYFRHLAVGLHHLALIEKLRLWSPRAEREVMSTFSLRQNLPGQVYR